MTDQQRNNLMHTIQNALLSLCTTAAVGCFILLWNLNNFSIAQAEKNKEYEKDIITLTEQFNYLNNQIYGLQLQVNRNDTRISILETHK